MVDSRGCYREDPEMAEQLCLLTSTVSPKMLRLEYTQLFLGPLD